MKKKPIKYAAPKSTSLGQILQEPEIAYEVDTSRFSSKGFADLSSTLGFSQAEWASILHISDRTLQRYLKEEKAFAGLQAELLHYLRKLTSTGQQLFKEEAGFVKWLRSPKSVLGQTLDFQSLQSITGIRLLQQELGRMAYGVYI
jgi:putative toxin-antitoxin system antitoxin component (TIGR02293 family)